MKYIVFLVQVFLSISSTEHLYDVGGARVKGSWDREKVKDGKCGREDERVKLNEFSWECQKDVWLWRFLHDYTYGFSSRFFSSSFFATPPPPPPRLPASWSACRHHGPALADCLHADGCRDHACHLRFCSTDRSVVSPRCTCVPMVVVFFHPCEWNVFCRRSVLCQHHGDCRHVCSSHSHRPPVPSPQPKLRTNAALGELQRTHCLYNAFLNTATRFFTS